MAVRSPQDVVLGLNYCSPKRRKLVNDLHYNLNPTVSYRSIINVAMIIIIASTSAITFIVTIPLALLFLVLLLL